MAKGKNSEHHSESKFEETKRFFDNMWKEKFGRPLSDWIVNLSKKPEQVRQLACFATPDICHLEEKTIVFYTEKSGAIGRNARQSKQLFEGNFITTLQEMDLSVHQELMKKSIKWDEMDTRQKIGFAKAIWGRRDFVGREVRGLEKIPFEPWVQELLCRMAGAPHPNSLKLLLEDNSIDIELLEVLRNSG